MSAFPLPSEAQRHLQNMASGALYQPAERPLILLRRQAQKICQAYNMLPPVSASKRYELLKLLLDCPQSVQVEATFYIEYGQHCKIGKGSFINHNVTILDICPISIGNQVLIGPNSVISSIQHRTTPLGEPLPAQESGLPVKIGHRVWLGANVTICAGVTIGDNAVIGAGSVVSTDIPANAVAFGNPATVQYKITQSSQ